jgi:Circularly permutated YpsA SLOG family
VRTRLIIVSGGQTGVDRGALDAALDEGAACGGWCPEGRLAEDGQVPERYPLRELANAGYVERTRQNVLDTDGTLVIFFGRVEGGTAQTVDYCIEHGKPHRLIDATEVSAQSGAALAAGFVREFGIRALNIAGPRASKQVVAHRYARELTARLLRILASD